MFWRKTKSRGPKLRPGLEWLDFAKLPILSAQEIVKHLSLESRLKSIEKLTGTGSEYYQLLYAPALRQYIESVQLVPASTAHHHAGPGGLVIHTLDVIDIALRDRKSYNLPQQALAETIAQQEHAWTYAIFAAGLLQDIGKLICDIRLLLDTGTVWTPHGDNILQSGAKHYTVVFERTNSNLHTRLRNGFLHLLPPRGRGWLAQFPDILTQLTAWLNGDPYEWGTIGEIVRQAVDESVTRNLKMGGNRKRFPNAPTAPLVDTLTTTLRQLLDEGRLKINRADGGAGWCDGPYTYLLCGSVGDAVRSYLYNAGATETPLDNSHIFETWLAHGFVEGTPAGDAVWHLTIDGKLTLKVLKFETGRIFHPSRRPGIFPGRLEITTQKPAVTQNPSPQTEPTEPPTGGVTDTTLVDDSDIAHHFLSWIRTGLRENRIPVNHRDALLHVVKEGVLIVTPLAFLGFVREFGLVEEDGDPREQAKGETRAAIKIQKKLERMLEKEKRHRKTEAGLNIHTYRLLDEQMESKVHGWLLPVTAIYDDRPSPEPNPALLRLST